MPHLDLAGDEALFYEYTSPSQTQQTFVFVNALTGNVDMWSGEICKALQSEGYGTLCFNFRGQAKTKFSDETRLTPSLIVNDLCTLINYLKPPAPIFVGLSIGGLFAAQAYQAGVDAKGIVLINTLRKPSQRLRWINKAMVNLAQIGGSRMVMMANVPVIASPKLLDSLWDSTFAEIPLESPLPNDGLFRLMTHSLETDWDFPYETLEIPVMILTGQHDRLFRIDEDIAELTSRIADATSRHYLDSGHLIPIEEPERLVEDLKSFSRRCIQTG